MLLKSKNILKVINNFKKVLPLAKKRNHLSMTCGVISDPDHPCGTVHCHGGWYLIAKKGTNLSHYDYDFTDGCDAMARDLGFDSPDKLVTFFMIEEKIWGNRYAGVMFAYKYAFYNETDRQDGAESLQDIVDHWTEVYERVLAIELEEKKQKLLSNPPVNDLINNVLEKQKKAIINY